MTIKDQLRKTFFGTLDKESLRGDILLRKVLSKSKNFKNFLYLQDGILTKPLINITNRIDFKEIVGSVVSVDGQLFTVDELDSVYEQEVKIFFQGPVSKGGKYRITLPVYKVSKIKDPSLVEKKEVLDFYILMNSYYDLDLMPSILGLPNIFGVLTETESLVVRNKYQKECKAMDIFSDIEKTAEKSVEEFENLKLEEEI